MEKKKFLNGTDRGSKREPATNASSAPVDVATGIIELRNDALAAVSGGYICRDPLAFGGDGGWLVIADSTRELLDTCKSASAARERALELGQSAVDLHCLVRPDASPAPGGR